MPRGRGYKDRVTPHLRARRSAYRRSACHAVGLQRIGKAGPDATCRASARTSRTVIVLLVFRCRTKSLSVPLLDGPLPERAQPLSDMLSFCAARYRREERYRLCVSQSPPPGRRAWPSSAPPTTAATRAASRALRCRRSPAGERSRARWLGAAAISRSRETGLCREVDALRLPMAASIRRAVERFGPLWR